MIEFKQREPVDLIDVGYVSKARGVQGQIQVILEEGMKVDFSVDPFIFLKRDGLHIPYKLEAAEENKNILFLNVQDIESKEVAKKLVGSRVALRDSQVVASSKKGILDTYVNYIVFDKETRIGQITNIQDFNGNIVAFIAGGETEHLIPFQEHFIKDIDEDEMKIVMDLPEGLY